MLTLVWCCMCLYNFRKIHITRATLDALGGAYVVEAGSERPRNTYLEEHGVLETFFIVSKSSDVTCNITTVVRGVHGVWRQSHGLLISM